MLSYTDEILTIIKQKKGIDLSRYRRHTVERRISNRMARLQAADPETYLELLKSDPHECDSLVNNIGINVSSFFRNPVVFEIIEQSVLPLIITRKRASNSREIRIWSIGCAAGEEAYSVAILVHQAFEKEQGSWKPYIFATDMDSDALEKAGTGIYQRQSLATTKLGILDKYFISKGSMYEVCPFIKDIVHFSLDDCTSFRTIAPAESVFGSFDMVLCRNVLIYFSKELQKNVFDKLYKAIGPRGYLILGDSESLSWEIESKFEATDGRNRIFQKK